MPLQLFDFSKAIGALNKDNKYAEALEYFKQHKNDFTKEQIKGNQYIIADLMTALRHTNKFDNGINLLSYYDIPINTETPERILSGYGWLLYSKFKNENVQGSDSTDHGFDDETEEEHIPEFVGSKYSKSDLVVRIEGIIPLLKQRRSQFVDNLIGFLFQIVNKTEKKKPSPNWQFINEYCDLFDPAELKTECVTIKVERKGVMKDMELASDQENWYAYKTKALMKTGKYQECLELSKKALESFTKFHYSNDVWFSRRIALSKKKMGNDEDTIKELKNILQKKKEWYIQKELAEILFEKGNIEEAFQYSNAAALNHGDVEFKVDLFYLMSMIYKKKNETDLAFKHLMLSKLLRLKHDWNVPQKITVEIGLYGTEEIPAEKLESLLIELKGEWKTKANNTATHSSPNQSENVRFTGRIETILHDNEQGVNGFIKYEANSSAYFNVARINPLAEKMKEGKHVEFSLTSSPNGKQKAIRIKLV